VTTTISEPPARPAALDFGLELPRTVAEYALFMAAEPLLQRAPAGDGHHVLVLPGFLADDCSTLGLRWHLRNLGYTTHGWDLGRNVGPTREIVAGMRQCLDSLADEHGEKISLIGWSLGGIYAREMARDVPEEVRQVITLASPFRLTNLAQTRTGRLYQYYRPRHEPRYQVPPYAASHRPLAVPSTAIYTRNDGIVAWSTCVQPVGPIAENIEVRGSHCSLGHNVGVAFAVGDRLAQPEGEWQPFKPPAALRYLYPTPVDG
jgi:pimeloyl-ACP methyl ester carboxylesterase